MRTTQKLHRRKVSYALTTLAALGLVGAQKAFAQSTQGTLYIEQVGSGAAALTSAGTALFLDSFTNPGTTLGSAGTQTQLNLTTAGSTLGSAPSIVDSGTATSEGALTQAGSYLTFVGYDAPVGTASVVASTNPRGVGFYNLTTGVVDTSTQLAAATSYSGNNIRSATTMDGSTIYTAGTAASITTGGVRVTSTGMTTSTSVESLQVNTRYVENYNGNIYFSSGSSTGIYEITPGVGTTNTTPVVVAASISSPYGFVFADGGNTLYVADSTNGIEKFTGTGGVFTQTAVETINIAGGGFSGIALAGTDGSGNDVLYAVDGLTASSGLYSIDDTGSGVTPTLVLAAPTNTAFRGIAFVPTAAPEPSGLVAMFVGVGALGLLVARRRRGGTPTTA